MRQAFGEFSRTVFEVVPKEEIGQYQVINRTKMLERTPCDVYVETPELPLGFRKIPVGDSIVRLISFDPFLVQVPLLWHFMCKCLRVNGSMQT